MQLPFISEQQLKWTSCAIVATILIIGFTFRDTFSDWKETLKAKVRKWLHDKVIDSSIQGDSANTAVGFFPVLVRFMDDHFLKPSVDEVIKVLDDENDGEEGDEEEGEEGGDEEGGDEEGEDEGDEEGGDEEGEEGDEGDEGEEGEEDEGEDEEFTVVD